MLPVVLALPAAACFASSTAAQHRAASSAPEGSGSGMRPVLGLLRQPLRALVVAGATGVVLDQSSYRVGVLTASQPATTIAEPVAAAVVGAAAFGGWLSAGDGVRVVQLLGVLLVISAVVVLARLTAGEAPGADPSKTTRETPHSPEEELC